MALQGLALFDGINQDSVIAANYTAAHGISPGVGTITVTPDTVIGTGGDFRFTFGSNVVLLKNCRADLATLQLSGDGFHWDVQILDRRWKWRFGEISGFWNRINEAGDILSGSEKTPQQLATMLLEAMGESGFNVSQMPNETRPLVEWVSDNPAEELARLCDDLGCRIVLHLDNRVRLHRIGVGSNLLGVIPGLTMASGRGIDPPEKPDSIKVIGGPTLHQIDLSLEAVGLDKVGGIKLIDDLSYTPLKGWDKSDVTGGFPELLQDPEAHRLAKQTVFRWYRPKLSTPIVIPESITVSSLDQILPLFNEQVEFTVNQITGKEERNPAIVFGVFYRFGFNSNTPTAEDWTNGFRIINEKGIVEFPVPMRLRKFISESQPHEYAPAILNLRTSFFVRGTVSTGGNYSRVSLNKQDPPPFFGTGPEVVDKQDEIRLEIWQRPRGPFQNNMISDQIQKKLNDCANATFIKYETGSSGEETYAGIIPFDLDGAIQQVTYSVGENGAETSVSLNRESNPFYPIHAQRRRMEAEKQSRKEAKAGAKAERRLKRWGKNMPFGGGGFF